MQHLDRGTVHAPMPRAQPEDGPVRVRLALVLGGGGSKGALQAGLYRAMREAGLRPDLIVGASVGAINGAFIAAGVRAETLARGWTELTRSALFAYNWSLLWRGLKASSVFSPRPLRALLSDHLPVRTFGELPTPLSVVTAHLSSGDACTWERGGLMEALLASTAIPGLLPPVRGPDGELHVDGSLVDNVPVEIALRRGATHVIAMNCRTCDACRRDSARLPDVLGQAFSIAADCGLRRASESFREAQNVLFLQPDMGVHVNALDFSQGRRLVAAGYECAREPLRRWAERLRELGWRRRRPQGTIGGEGARGTAGGGSPRVTPLGDAAAPPRPLPRPG